MSTRFDQRSAFTPALALTLFGGALIYLGIVLRTKHTPART
jgi:hypothetical protein